MWWKPSPCIFQVLDGGADFYSSFGDAILILIKGFPLAFPTLIALTPQSRNERQLLSISTPITHYKTEEVTTVWFLETFGLTIRLTSAKSSLINHLTSTILYVKWRATVFLGVSRNLSIQNQYPTYPGKSDCFFPYCTVIFVKGRRLFGKRLKKA